MVILKKKSHKSHDIQQAIELSGIKAWDAKIT